MNVDRITENTKDDQKGRVQETHERLLDSAWSSHRLPTSPENIENPKPLKPGDTPGPELGVEIADKPASRTEENWMARHESLVKRVQSSHAEVAFFGDSITEAMNVDLMHKIIGPEASNFGIGGDRTQNLLWRMQHGELDFPAPGPKAFILLIGTNNLAAWPTKAANTNEQVLHGVQADVNEIRKHYPDAKILLMGILPRDEKPDTDLRKHVSETNGLLKKLAATDTNHIQYADIGSAFLEPDGTISPKVMSDYLHPTANEGYLRMFTALKPEIDRMLDKK